MSVFVEPRRDYYLLTSPASAELHGMAARLGLRLARYVPGSGYLVDEEQRARALALGAVDRATVTE